ncbi:MAG: hypothetical protein ACXWBP_07710 [Limisphaerales bacterium]
MKTRLAKRYWSFCKTLPNLALLFCLLSAVPAIWSAPVVDTVTKVVASDATNNLLFGFSVAIDDATAAVGALDGSHGAVYTYALVGGNWVQTQKILDFAPTFLPDSFGFSLALEGDLLVVGQPQGFFEPELSGQALVFRRSGGTWGFETKFLEEPHFPESGFGSSVSLSDGTIAVGRPNDPAGPGSGAVSIFTYNGTDWNLQSKVTAPAGTSQAFFGSAVSVNNDTLLVGAPQVGVTGATFVFVRSGTNWTLQTTLSSVGLHTAAGFGSAVSLEGDTAVVGAPGQSTNGIAGGAVYIFHRFGSNWVLQQELTPTDNANGLGFGTSLSIQNGTVVVGVPFRTVSGQANAGGADIFTFNGTSWALAQHIAAPDPMSGAEFGNAVDIGASGIIAGARFDSGAAPDAGAAYIFSESQTNVPVIVSASASPNVLFPPNHKMVPVTISVATQGNDVSCRIVSVSSNQPINGNGDGNTSPDWTITGDLTVLLRAERAGNIKTDRVYAITVQCADAFGNTANTTVQVTVPHDRGK